MLWQVPVYKYHPSDVKGFFQFIAADGFVVQTGDPEGPAEGFIDPSTEKTRTIPLEIMVNGEKAPFYGATLEVSSSLSCVSYWS